MQRERESISISACLDLDLEPQKQDELERVHVRYGKLRANHALSRGCFRLLRTRVAVRVRAHLL